MADEWLTVAQAAELSGYHPEYVRDLIRRGEVEARTISILFSVRLARDPGVLQRTAGIDTPIAATVKKQIRPGAVTARADGIPGSARSTAAPIYLPG